MPKTIKGTGELLFQELGDVVFSFNICQNNAVRRRLLFHKSLPQYRILVNPSKILSVNLELSKSLTSTLLFSVGTMCLKQARFYFS